MSPLLTDPWFYATALPAVILTGLSKGGFQGASLLSLPLLALAMNPVQAAAVMLPVLIFQDIFSVSAFRRSIDWRMLRLMAPGVLAGTAVGWATASFVTADHIRLMVGVIALVFTVMAVARRQVTGAPRPHNGIAASFWGLVSAFTSFLVHAGGAPFSVYALPRRLAPELLAGTTAVFFSAVNLLKIPPYFQLGQLSWENFQLSLALMPMAGAANLAGIWLVRRIELGLFYKILYALLFFVSLKLVWDGATALWH